MPLSEHRCFGCMNVYSAEAEVCPVCGYPSNGKNPPEFLPAGTVLAERYHVGRVLSFSGTTACYIAYDRTSNAPVYLREFMPAVFCERTETGALCPKEQTADAFSRLRDRFDTQGRTLAKLRDVAVLLPVYDLFKQNGTSYTVSEYLKPYTLSDRLAQKGGRLSWTEARKLILPFMSSLLSCHSAGLYHLAICPQNLLIDESGKLRLTDFDLPEVRRETDRIAPQLVPGYAAPEQYTLGKTVGAPADVYAVAATLFRMLTGNPPMDGSKRDAEGNDLFLPADVAYTLPKHVSETLADALLPDTTKRIQTLAELRDRLSTGTEVSALAQEAEAMNSGLYEAPIPPRFSWKKAVVLLCVLLVLGALVAGAVLWAPLDFLKNNRQSPTATAVPTATATAAPTATKTDKPLFPMPDFSDGTQDYYALPLDGDKRMADSHPVVVRGYQFSDTVPAGNIVAQEPAPGTPESEDATLSVYLSAGEARTTVPDVTGWKAEHAKLYLEALGFRVETTEGADTSVDVGCVFGTWPDAGTEPQDGNKVTLRVNNTAADDNADEQTDENDTDEEE